MTSRVRPQSQYFAPPSNNFLAPQPTGGYGAFLTPQTTSIPIPTGGGHHRRRSESSPFGPLPTPAPRPSSYLGVSPQRTPAYVSISPKDRSRTPAPILKNPLNPPVRVPQAPIIRQRTPAPQPQQVIRHQQQPLYPPLDDTDDRDRSLPRRPWPNAYWATPTVLGSEYPSRGNLAETRQRLQILLDLGVTDFIDLIEAGEALPGEQYVRPLQQLAVERGLKMIIMNNDPTPRTSSRGNGVSGGGFDWQNNPDPYTIRYVNFVIKDTTTPDQATLQALMNAMYYSQNQKRRIILHCNGGYGRTGTIMGCFLVFMGYFKDTVEQPANTYMYNTQGQLVPYVKTKRAGEYALEFLAKKWAGVEKSRLSASRFTPGNTYQMDFVKAFRPPQQLAQQPTRAR